MFQFVLQHITKIFVFKLCVILHTGFITPSLIRRTIDQVSTSIDEKHVNYNSYRLAYW